MFVQKLIWVNKKQNHFNFNIMMATLYDESRLYGWPLALIKSHKAYQAT